MIPGEMIESQAETIGKAIDLLTASLDKLTQEISPHTDSWRDVSRFADVADLAGKVLEHYSYRTGGN